MTFDELVQLLDKTEAIIKYKETRSEVLALREQVKKTQEELSKYKNLKIMFADKEINLETFEKKVSEQTLKVYGEEINLKVDKTLKTQSAWPKWFKELVQNEIQSGIKKGLDQEFLTRVQVAISNAKQLEWPRFLEEYTMKVVTPLCRESAINFLKSPVTIEKPCDKCGIVVAFTLNPENMAGLIKNPFIVGCCLNPQCRDFIVRHRIRITLGDVIMHLAGKPLRPIDQWAGS